jgi:hypothetical protein
MVVHHTGAEVPILEHSSQFSPLNSSAPLCRLPPELVVCVLKYLQYLPYHINLHSELAGVDIKWRHAMYVCSYIRAVAISAPELWAFVDCTRMAWAKLSIGRAGNTPITISLYNKQSPPLESFLFVAEHLSRAIAADILCDLPSEGEIASQALRNKLYEYLPEMEKLSFSGPVDWNIHKSFLGSRAPRLQRLDLRECRIKELPELPNLKLLYLGGIDLAQGFTTLYKILQQLPMLEVLDIGHVEGPSLDRVSNIRSCSLPLEKLREIYLSGSIFVIDFLLFILPNPKLKLHVRVSNEHFAETPLQHHYSEIITQISSYWNAVSGEASLPNGQLTHARWVHSYESRWTATLTFRSEPSEDTPSFYLSLPCEVTGPDPLLPLIKSITVFRPEEVLDILDTEGKPLLSGLREVTICGAGLNFFSPSTLQWLKNRDSEGYRLSKLIFRYCDKRGKEVVEAESYGEFVDELEWIDSAELRSHA